MGNCLPRIFRRQTVRHVVLILIGLDNAGKTQTVNSLAGDVEKTLPTVGFKAVNLLHRDIPVTIYDLGGGPAFRQIWPQYYSEVHGVIFVIDSSDFSRLEECKSVLEEVLSHDKISGKPVLVLANKQDKQGALDDIDVVEKFNIEPLVNRYRCPTLVESYTASVIESKKPKIDPGLLKGYQWLLNYIESRYGDINLRVQTDIHADLERRKRLMNKFTERSNDIVSETGFENPNYKSLSRNKTITSDKTNSEIIIVKPALKNTIDSSITISDESNTVNNSKDNPSLSPLFGVSNKITETVKIELEPKSDFRKLSPIFKKRFENNLDFSDRPHSSPVDKTYIKEHSLPKFKVKKENLSLETDIKEEDLSLNEHSLTFNDIQNDISLNTEVKEDLSFKPKIKENLSPESDKEKEYSLTKSEVKDRHKVVVDEMELSIMQKELVLTQRVEMGSKSTSSEVHLPASIAPAPRPASASQLVRRQLEILPTTPKRRLSLRYGHRNKTSPESLAVFSLSKGRAKGDFDTHTYLAHTDVTL